MIRSICTTLLIAFVVSGCVTQSHPLQPPKEPSAQVSDSATGGGKDGAALFYVVSVNGKPVSPNILHTSRAASFNRGFDMRLGSASRYFPAGRSKLVLKAQYEFAAPIQSLFKSASSWEASGEIEVDLVENGRYKVVGALDSYRREVWLQDEKTGAMVGTKIVAVSDPAKRAASADASFTCCNLHYEDDWISDGNFIDKPMIPAGAELVVKSYGRSRAKVEIDGRPMRIGQDYGNERETIQAFINRLSSKSNPQQRVAAFPERIQAAIRAGKVVRGMTKEQAIIALGYPRIDETASTDLPQWIYWTNDEQKFVLLWDSDQRLRDVDALPKIKALVLATD